MRGQHAGPGSRSGSTNATVIGAVVVGLLILLAVVMVFALG